MKIDLNNDAFVDLINEDNETLPELEKSPEKRTDDELPKEGKAGVTKSLDEKVDSLTEKMDRVLDYIAQNSAQLAARDKLNALKFEKVEKAFNFMVDNLSETADQVATCKQKLSQQDSNIGAHRAAIT